MTRVIVAILITLCTGVYAEAGDKYLEILKAHTSFKDDGVKYFISIYTSLNDGVVFQIIVKNDGSVEYVRNVVDFAHQNNGSAIHAEFDKVVETTVQSPLADDINTFIPQTLITYKSKGNWVTNWFSSGEILADLFMVTRSDK